MLLILVGNDEGAGLHGDLGCVTEAYNEVGVRIDEVGAVGAGQQELGQDLILGEAGPGVELLLQSTPAPRAAELLVVLFPDLESWGEHILVTFDESQDDLRVHLDEVLHEPQE